MKHRILSALSLLLAAAVSSCEFTESEVAVQEVILNRDNVDILTGSTFQLVAMILPDNATDKKVSWSSSSEDVASVGSDGLVTALKAGVSMVTAKSGAILAACKVTVADPVVDVESITLNHTELELTTGDEVTLEATVLPENATDKTVTWSSSDESVISVEDGRLTALAAGSATVVATAGQKTAQCVVTVTRNMDSYAAGIYLVGKEGYEYEPGKQQISIYSAEGNSWYRFLFPSTLMMYQVGPIPDTAVVGDSVNVLLETFTSGVETAQPAAFTLVIQSMEGGIMKLASADGDLFILRY